MDAHMMRSLLSLFVHNKTKDISVCMHPLSYGLIFLLLLLASIIFLVFAH